MTSTRVFADAGDAEAAGWVADEVERLCSLPYDELAGLVGKAQHEEIQSASAGKLDLETRIVWDDNRRRSLYVTLNVWDPGGKGQAYPTEVAHDEFALSPDGRGGVVGPVRRREAAEHSPAARNNRRLFYGLVVAIGWTAWGWEDAGSHHFSAGATGFAWAMTALWLVGTVLAIWRWRQARHG